jgi:hypothetical protein
MGHATHLPWDRSSGATWQASPFWRHAGRYPGRPCYLRDWAMSQASRTGTSSQVRRSLCGMFVSPGPAVRAHTIQTGVRRSYLCLWQRSCGEYA